MAPTEPASPYEIGYITEPIDTRNPASVFQRIAQNEFDYESANEEVLDLRAQLQARLKVIENLATERKALDKLAFYYLRDQLHECVIAHVWSPVEAKQIPYAVFVNPLSPSTTALRVVRSSDLAILTETEAREFEARGPLTTTPKESKEPATTNGASAKLLQFRTRNGLLWNISPDRMSAQISYDGSTTWRVNKSIVNVTVKADPEEVARYSDDRREMYHRLRGAGPEMVGPGFKGIYSADGALWTISSDGRTAYTTEPTGNLRIINLDLPSRHATVDGYTESELEIYHRLTGLRDAIEVPGPIDEHQKSTSTKIQLVIDPSGQKWIVSEDGLHARQGDSEIDATLGYAAAKAKYNSNQLNVWAQMSCNRRDSVWSTNS